MTKNELNCCLKTGKKVANIGFVFMQNRNGTSRKDTDVILRFLFIVKKNNVRTRRFWFRF